MKITVDNREHDLYDKLVSLAYDTSTPTNVKQLTCNQLTLGDILIQTETLDNIVLIERKSLKDLLASIKDGRYEEQSHRLIHSSGFPTHNIMYIIEGPINTLRNLAERKLVYSCITSLNIFKGFSVVRTSSLQETAELIVMMTDKIKRNLDKGIKPCFSMISHTRPDEQSEIQECVASIKEPCDYSQVVKKVKKDNITRGNIGQIVLCQIPGISSKSALAIMSKFGTFSNLLTCLENDPDCMANIVYESGDGKHRKISKVCAQNIYKLFIQRDTE